jgi:hypothetical protein
MPHQPGRWSCFLAQQWTHRSTLSVAFNLAPLLIRISAISLCMKLTATWSGVAPCCKQQGNGYCIASNTPLHSIRRCILSKHLSLHIPAVLATSRPAISLRHRGMAASDQDAADQHSALQNWQTRRGITWLSCSLTLSRLPLCSCNRTLSTFPEAHATSSGQRSLIRSLKAGP